MGRFDIIQGKFLLKKNSETQGSGSSWHVTFCKEQIEKRAVPSSCRHFSIWAVGLTSSSIVVRVKMDLFQHRYYRLSKTLMTLIGQWPYQSIRTRRTICTLLIFLITSQTVPEILAVVKYNDNLKIVLEGVISFLFVAVCSTKLITFVCNLQKTLKLLNRICTDWKVWARDPEVNILHAYVEQGEQIIIMYTAMIYSTTLLFLTQPIAPKIIDVLLKNGTEPGKFPLPVDYYHLDPQKYYFYLIVYSCICVCAAVTVLLASDIMLITYVHHVCGIFGALGHKLKRIMSYDTSLKKGDRSHTLGKSHMLYLASCIDKHNDAIKYASLIEATYKWSFFFILGFGMIMINGILLEVFLKTSDPEVTLRFTAYALTGILHFYIECYISQMLMDHSGGIHFYIHNSQWYRLSPFGQKLVQLMMIRCGIPCHLTAGNFFILSVKTFGQTVRTGMSYFTLLRTMQI